VEKDELPEFQSLVNRKEKELREKKEKLLEITTDKGKKVQKPG